MSATGQRAGRGSLTRRIVALRRWLLAGAAMLTFALLALFGWQIHRLHRAIHSIPDRLGIDIRSQADGITYTQSVKGRVLFTVHASKEVQRKDGKTTLHDVSILVVGKPGTNRTDSIRGDDFEYDQANGVVKALGDVNVDLAAPDAGDARHKANATRIQVTTRGLILLQKLGVAATDEPVQFVYGDLHGSARGADYDADTGTLRLRSQVLLDGVRNGKVLHVKAADAQLVRSTQQVTLHQAQVQSGGDRAAGDVLIFSLAKDGSVQAVEGEGNVAVDTANGGRLSSSRLTASLGASGQPQLVAATGNVHLQDVYDTATAGSALLHFDSGGEPVTAELSDAVQVNASGSSGEARSELKAARAVLHLVSEGKRTEMRDLQADGGASVTTVQQVTTPQQKGSAPLQPRAAVTRTTTLFASVLHAATAVADGTRYVSSVDGQGRTRLEQSDSLGNRSVSTANMLHAVLGPPSPAGTARHTTASLLSVEQDGNVQIERRQTAQVETRSAAAIADGENRAIAQHAIWRAETGTLKLTGDPVVTSPSLQLSADEILLSQTGADTEAHGNVKGTLQGSKEGTEPLHVLATASHINKGGNAAEFDGGAVPVRMWTSAAQLEAMRIIVDREKNTLTADGGSAHSSPDVRLFLSGQAGRASQQQVLRGRESTQITGQHMTIFGAKGEAPTRVEAAGSVRLRSGESDLRAGDVVATLKKASTSTMSPPGPTGLLSGDNSGLSTMTATGDVQLRQPGRIATGQRLVYNASNDQYQLTGTAATPSTLYDSVRGNIRGLSLVFYGGGQRVEVSDTDGSQVHTEVPAQREHSHEVR